MPVTNIPVSDAPFQGGKEQYNDTNNYLNGFNLSNGATSPSKISVTATEEMSFVNDGYSVLFCSTGTGASGVTGYRVEVSGIDDNAGRDTTIAKNLNVRNYTVAGLGPFRPIWFNEGGKVNVSFSASGAGTTGFAAALAATQVSVVRFRF